MLAVSEVGSLTLWDTAGGQKRATWTNPSGRAYLGAFSPDGQTFGALSWGRGSQFLMIDLIDVASGRIRASLPTPAGGIVRGGLTFTDDGQYLRVVAFDKKALLVLDFDAASGIVRGGLTFTDDGQYLRVMMYDKKALLVFDCDVASGRWVSNRTLSCSTFQNSTNVSSDGRLLAFAPSLTKDMVLWDVEQDREVGRLPGGAQAERVSELFIDNHKSFWPFLRPFFGKDVKGENASGTDVIGS
jgi:WD40 repeat protein